MKKIIGMLLITAIAVCAKAQTIGSPGTITGTNLFLMQQSIGVGVTNTPYYNTGSHTLVLGGVASTNETAIVYSCVQLPSNWSLMPGQSNIYVIGVFSNNFVNGTNGGTWTTNFNTFGTFNFPTFMGTVLQPNLTTNTATCIP